MNIRYDGPRKSIEIQGFGEHKKGEIKEYPDDFGKTLLESSKRQRFANIKQELDKEPKAKPKSKKKG